MVRFQGVAKWKVGENNVEHQHYQWRIGTAVVADGVLGRDVTSRQSMDDQVSIEASDQLIFEIESVNAAGSSEPLVLQTEPMPLPDPPHDGDIHLEPLPEEKS